MKIQKKWGGGGAGYGGRGLGRGGGRVGWGSGGGCERRIEVFGKIHKKKNSGWGWLGGGGRVGGGVRVNVNEELKFFENSKKKLLGGGRVGCGWGQGGCE